MNSERNSRLLMVIPLLLILCLTPQVGAVTGLGLGVKGGVVTDYDNPNIKLSDFEFNNLKYFGGFAEFRRSSVAFELGAEYYWDSQMLLILDEEHEVKAKDFFIGVTGKVYFPFPLVQPFVGLGVASHKFTFEYNGPLGQYENVTLVVPDDKAYFGYHLVVGARLAVAVIPFDLFVEGKIGKVNTDPDSTKFKIISVGLVFKLP
jgi:hypothetical protein